MGITWKWFGLFSVAALLLITAVRAEAAADKQPSGESLYRQSCAGCHSDKPGKMMGKPVADLLDKMTIYATMPSPTGRTAAMQNVLKSLTDQQKNDVAVYLNALR